MKRVILSNIIITAATAIAAAATPHVNEILASRTLADGIEMQVVSDNGRIYKRLAKDGKAAVPQAAPPKTVRDATATGMEQTFYEGFEGYDDSFGLNWIPQGWTKQNTEANKPTPEQISHNVNNSWYVYFSSEMYQELTTDGICEAFIHYSYDGNYCTEEAQDEWLISPEITLKDDETLSFMLQADFFNIYNCDDFDWDGIAYPTREVVNTMSVMLTTDGGSTWNPIWDLAEDVASQMTDQECYDASDLRYRDYDISLAHYAGKTVKIAFRYIREKGGWNGNSMILDRVIVQHPQGASIKDIEAGYNADAAAYFNLNGIQVDASELSPGIYIRRTGQTVEKVAIR